MSGRGQRNGSTKEMKPGVVEEESSSETTAEVQGAMTRKDTGKPIGRACRASNGAKLL